MLAYKVICFITLSGYESDVDRRRHGNSVGEKSPVTLTPLLPVAPTYSSTSQDPVPAAIDAFSGIFQPSTSKW